MRSGNYDAILEVMFGTRNLISYVLCPFCPIFTQGWRNDFRDGEDQAFRGGGEQGTVSHEVVVGCSKVPKSLLLPGALDRG